MAQIECNLITDIEFDPDLQAVTRVTLRLPAEDGYHQVDGEPLTPRDWLKLYDWSWERFEFVSALPRTTEFEVVGRWSDGDCSDVVRVTTDTPLHALAISNVEHSTGAREFVATTVLFDGAVIATAG